MNPWKIYTVFSILSTWFTDFWYRNNQNVRVIKRLNFFLPLLCFATNYSSLGCLFELLLLLPVMLYHLYTFYSLWPERFHDFHLFHSSMAKRTCRMLPHVWTEIAVTTRRKSYGLSNFWKMKSSYIWKLLWAVTAYHIIMGKRT